MRLGRTLALAAAAGALFYVGFAAYSGFHKVVDALEHYAWATAAAALCLAAINYLLRFMKWELYLRRLDVRIPLRDSFGIFLSGFSLTVTPGKVGEVLKSYLLREVHGVPMARTAPIVVAERLTDLVALAALALVGVGALAGGERIAWVALGLVGVAVAVVASERLAHAVIDLVGAVPGIGKLAPKLREFYAATKQLLAPAPLVVATLLSIVAWLCECVAFWLVLRGFDGAAASLKLCTFIYATMTIAGALSFLPGGLGVQEIGMVKLLIAQAHGVSEPVAAAATFITRLCTLWFAVLVGVIALVIMQRRTRVNLGELKRG
ncbi:MAG: Integral rane protein [bacterium]|nr:Integral rane protein [bacterium]